MTPAAKNQQAQAPKFLTLFQKLLISEVNNLVVVFLKLMAEFDNFDADFGGEPALPEVDPAAEFLAREQDELAGLEDDIIDSFEPGSAALNAIPNSQSPDEGASLIINKYYVQCLKLIFINY